MGNTKSSVSGCMPICGDKDTSTLNGKKYGKFKKSTKFETSKNNLKTMLEEEAFQRYQEIRYVSPIDNCFTYLEKQLINSNSEWATSLLYHYAGQMTELMDKKYKTYNWNIEVNLQEGALRNEAIRECLSDTMKEDAVMGAGSGVEELNFSSSEERDHSEDSAKKRKIKHHPLNQITEENEDMFHYGAAAIGKDGSMVLMKNSNLFPSSNQTNSHIGRPLNLFGNNQESQFMNRRLTNESFGVTGISLQTPNTRPITGLDGMNEENNTPPQISMLQDEEVSHQSHQLNQQSNTLLLDQAIDHNDAKFGKATSLELVQRNDRLTTQMNSNRIQNFLDTKKANDLFKRKVRIIKRHFKNSQHPLRMLADLFADELEKILKRSLNPQTTDASHLTGNDLTQSQVNQKNFKSQIKLSDREKESDNLNQLKLKRFQLMQQIVKDFMLLLKHAIIRFYQIEYNKLRAFQKNYFTEKVKNLVLGYKVSKVLYQAASEAHREDVIDFSKALASLANVDLELYHVPPQFHLDEGFYIKEISKPKDTPIQIIQKNMDKTACEFRLQKLNANKSQLNVIDAQEVAQPFARPTIRLSEKNQRPIALMGEFLKEMPSSFFPLVNQQQDPDNDLSNEAETQAAPGLIPQNNNNIPTLEDNQSSSSIKITRESNYSKKARPYLKTATILKQVQQVCSLRKKRSIFIYAWKKLQKEVNDYWRDKVNAPPSHKLVLCEDHRLCLMAFVILQAQCADVYTSFLALNPFIDFNSMEEAVPMATVENAIQVILKDYNDRQGTAGADMVSCLEGGPYDNASKLAYDLVSQHRIPLPSQMSDNMSFRSTNYMNQIEGYKRQIEEIKFRQSRIWQQSVNQISQLPLPAANQIYGQFDQEGDDIEMDQEQEEEELHRRLNGGEDNFDFEEVGDKYENFKQRETLKRWQNNNALIQQRGLSFKTPRKKGEYIHQDQSIISMLRRSHAQTKEGSGPDMMIYSSVHLDQSITQKQQQKGNPIIRQQMPGRGTESGQIGGNRTQSNLQYQTPRLSATKKRLGQVE